MAPPLSPSHPAAPTSRDRIATRDLQEYDAVRAGEFGFDEDDGSAPEDFSDEEAPRQRRGSPAHRQRLQPRRRRPPPPPRSSGGGSAAGCCGGSTCSVALAATVLLLGLVTYHFRHDIVQRLPALPYSGAPPRPAPAPYGSDSGTASGTALAPANPPKRGYTIHYDPLVGQPRDWNPYDVPPHPPVPPLVAFGENPQQQQQPSPPPAKLGYLQQPSMHNGTLVFVSEGDLYLASLRQRADPGGMPAMRLTTTVGNVQSPRLHGAAVAFSATYTGRRDLYLMRLPADAAASPTTTRLTYTATTGVRGVCQLTRDAVLFAAPSDRVGLPDTRLFRYSLRDGTQTPVPLAQATDGTAVSGEEGGDSDDRDSCLYFVRYRQGSHTARYVGGTAENLWAYCDGADRAVPLTADYNGTSRAPGVAAYRGSDSGSGSGQKYLLFLSDRAPADGGKGQWRATTMNLWAAPLPTREEMYGADGTAASAPLTDPVQITHVSCQFQGMALQEYSVDPVTGDLVLRIGADLYHLTAQQVEQRLQGTASTVTAQRLPIQVYSDFHEQQERQVKINPLLHLTGADVVATAFGTVNLLATMRGQTWVFPVVEATSKKEFQGAGQNLPPRRYRVVPGAMTGGMMRVLVALNVPLLLEEADAAPRRLSLVLATDPLSPTAEHAFYLVETQSDAANVFADLEHLPEPILGGLRGGGSTKSGGLGSVRANSVTVSPCGRRMAWTDTDGRILVMTMPVYVPNATYKALNLENDLGEPMDGTLAVLQWSPGGRYLAVEHQARNQFSVITVVDCGDPGDDSQISDISLGRHAQATPSRFNSFRMFWGKSTFDYYLQEKLQLVSILTGSKPPEDVATTLYFLTDRDVMTDVASPWGSRAPSPHFMTKRSVWALPLVPETASSHETESFLGRFVGGGAQELFVDDLNAFKRIVEDFETKAENGEVGDDAHRKIREIILQTWQLTRRLQSRKVHAHEAIALDRLLDQATKAATSRTMSRTLKSTSSSNPVSIILNTTDTDSLNASYSAVSGQTDASKYDLLISINNATSESRFPKDMNIHLGDIGLSFARSAYRMTQIPKGKYITILSQTSDDGTLVLADVENEVSFQLFSPSGFPADDLEQTTVAASIDNFGLSTCRKYVWIVFAPEGKTKVIPNSIPGWTSLLADVPELTHNMADVSEIGISVFPPLEYKQMFDDAWRLLRDYFYDQKMHGVDWPAVHERYSHLVSRCAKREELDDVLAQMASELSALHVFVYGGEYNSPIDEEDLDSMVIVTPGSLGVSMTRDAHWKGYRIDQIPITDPDFNVMDDFATFSPLSEQTLRLSGQKGLKEGDIIVAVNGESVMNVPDIHMLLRGTIGRSVRLEVLRLASSGTENRTSVMSTESVITSPISPSDASSLLYTAWEWRTREKAKKSATELGFSVAYIHMRSMLRDDEDAFARDFFPDYDAQALILDVRHNSGGNIDSWILTMLQRKAWMYWQGRTGMRRGDADWDEQFAFRGHIVVLIDEMTSSDGEGVSRGMSELGLGRLIGKRTWGGGIWLQSDNGLVDGGIATAPEIATFNKNFGWGLGIEQKGVAPDIEVDNNPRTSFDFVDNQLEAAIIELNKWLQDEPVVIPKPPKAMVDMSLHGENCPA